MNIQEKLTYFSVDKAFGCLTRPALEYQNKIGERGSDLSLIPKIFLSHPIIKDSML